jgi:adenylate cyclase
MSSFNDLAEGLLQKKHVENALSRYVSDKVADQILSNLESVELGGERVQGSVLFADIVGFTSMSEDMDPNEVADLLNEYFRHISRLAGVYQGSVDKFIGDCVMLLFGVPVEDQDHCFHAVACSVLLQKLVSRLNQARAEKNQFPVLFRVGVNAGQMLAGNMGSSERMEYTVVGDSVNLAARLCSAGEPGQIIITEDLHARPDVRDRIVAKMHEPMRLRGKSEPINSFIVHDVAEEYRSAMDDELAAIVEDVLASST